MVEQRAPGIGVERRRGLSQSHAVGIGMADEPAFKGLDAIGQAS